jgi:indolepyruvate ferredoxin oxidoreductase
MRLLARMRFLRNTRLDPFAGSRDRREERELIADYRELVTHVVSGLNANNHEAAVKLLSLPEQVRGFGPVKRKSIAQYRIERERLLREFDQPHVAVPQTALEASA